MRKDWNIVKNFAAAQGLDFVETNFPQDPEIEFDDSPLKAVLDEIFAVDELTGLPKGDIQYYMSANGNPQVKQWLENNILKPRMGSNTTMEGLTDDMIAEFSQMKDESVDAYRVRLTTIYDNAKAEYEKSLSESKTE